MGVLYGLRTAVFYILLSLSALVWSVVSLLAAPFLSFPARYRFITVNWCGFAVFLAKHLLNIEYRVTGIENIPSERCVILAKHQSTWETFFLSAYFQPLSQVLKKELFRVPFFGWTMALVKPIAIDRSNPKQALKQLAKQGAERLQENCWLLIFPEGTRVPMGKIGKFSRGGASLAVNAGLPVLPIAHNAGAFWPKQGWSKRPGVIDVVIGPAMYAEGEGSKAIAELNQRAFEWVAHTQFEIGALDEQVFAEIKEKAAK
ncbi:1-acyl-sn-glycerol-3-phosphate acyltransferase [Denitrificimonas sp. JX-1]|uniref:1-acyl-sn-glycerol-3-phosphate acyltransferase n=1 Tax=Denitrificimonas halotolerans TaxID=3098930 RepID=A0ABU5GQ14_9GAMM|nr:1-acyl-sn-glycerol-3-phosphate acyltransferase [Denitrificimonas sp. JX-1]MDY7218445.1 1-acyl-sn-glycerol-3-phosphate acyltransferase [Denitrificimonas sp. JX-1]